MYEFYTHDIFQQTSVGYREKTGMRMKHGPASETVNRDERIKVWLVCLEVAIKSN